jgi:hypothetical protein
MLRAVLPRILGKAEDGPTGSASNEMFRCAAGRIRETSIKFEKDESRFLDFAGLPEKRAIPLRSE